MIYMDNAATTMHKPQEVIDAVVSAMSSMGNAGRGASEAALSASGLFMIPGRDWQNYSVQRMQGRLHLHRILRKV